MSKFYRYRVSIADASGGAPTIHRGMVPAKKGDTDQHVRGRIMLDIMSRAEFNWVEQDPSLVDNIVKSAA